MLNFNAVESLAQRPTPPSLAVKPPISSGLGRQTNQNWRIWLGEAWVLSALGTRWAHSFRRPRSQTDVYSKNFAFSIVSFHQRLLDKQPPNYPPSANAASSTVSNMVVFRGPPTPKTRWRSTRRSGAVSTPAGAGAYIAAPKRAGQGNDTAFETYVSFPQGCDDVISWPVSLCTRLRGHLPYPMGPRLTPRFTSHIPHKGRDMTGYKAPRPTTRGSAIWGDFDSVIIFWISSRIPHVVNPGKFFQSNSICSPSIRSKS